MAGPVIVLGPNNSCLESLRELSVQLIPRVSRLHLVEAPLDPPQDLALWFNAIAFIIDGRQDTALAIAEAARLRPLSRPVGLLVKDRGLSDSAKRRASVSDVFVDAVSLQQLIRFRDSAILSLRRNGAEPDLQSSFALGETVYVHRARRLVVGREVALSMQKFELLCYLVDRAGLPVSASELVRSGVLRATQAPRLKGLIQELRTHLGSARDLIRPVPGFGYRLELRESHRSVQRAT